MIKDNDSDGGPARPPRRTAEFAPEFSSQMCDDVRARLIETDGAPEDAAAAAHVRSCLGCFRTATELRDVPRLAAALCRGAKDDDPGDAFWAAFPARVSASWAEMDQARAAAGARGDVTQVAAPGRLRRAIRQPAAAALLGAAAAAVLAVAFQRLPGTHPTEPAARVALSTPPRQSAAFDRTGGGARGEADDADRVMEKGTLEGRLGGVDDSLSELELPALETLVDEMRAETASLAPPDEAPPWRINPAGELELLDEEALERLLGGLPQTI